MEKLDKNMRYEESGVEMVNYLVKTCGSDEKFFNFHRTKEQ